MFWKEASKKTYNPPKPKPETNNKNTGLDFRGGIVEEPTNLSTSNNPDTTEAVKTEETTDKTTENDNEEKLPRIFPNTQNVFHFHPIAFINHMKLIFGEGSETGEICYAEARVRAFMRMLRVGEGSVGEKGYTTSYGHQTMTDLSKHPETVYLGSSAAGAYQMLRETYWTLQGYIVKDHKKVGEPIPARNLIAKYNIPDFSALSQDKLCIIYMKHHEKGLIKLLAEGQIEKAIRTKASKIWASLPNEGIPFEHKKSRYLMPDRTTYQPAEHMSDSCLMNYRKFYREEVKGITDLHLKPGFLKEFGFDYCKGETLSNNEGGWPVREFHNGHKRRFGSPFGPRNGHNHNGIDINFGSGYDDYGALVIATHDGIVIQAQENDDKKQRAGRRVTIQSKDGTFQTKYFHLSVFLVDIGDKIKKGQVIGEIGASAKAKENGTDCHLHYEILKKNSAGKMEHYDPTEGKANTGENIVDPQTWIK
ncbi:peptidoglycan DD-metalloendopeptidase family protein [Olleya sp. YSTF-M6]|uniref:Peptidoglycan DD-metalloendopeptidase family protein n=1 Tax=Olleya sediminilitoris TaxID=2795739 RepID=A0ABS1WLA9_9FLAO|nr:peptidoglycan DD-metalloendopeptidase family protein [Olleya sediminilitoris]MBL7559914.1 peptidoglycan DD-metalloendopeptidase family protein [Olleya sediminilitoris]